MCNFSICIHIFKGTVFQNKTCILYPIYAYQFFLKPPSPAILTFPISLELLYSWLFPD